MDFDVDTDGDVTVVSFNVKSLDAGNSKNFKTDISPLLEENNKFVFAMDSLTFVDSSGCGVMLSCLRKLNSTDGDVKLSGVNGPVHTLFELIRLHKIFEIYNTRDEAVKAYQL